jgi:ADP-heptose:LPS heptosyltransferase
MKILVLQLARLGDIYQSWPALRALRRQNPSAEIHLLCRRRFAGATEGLTEVDQVLRMDTSRILEPLFTGEDGTPETLARWNEFVDTLQAERYDAVINLSFSGVSAWLTRILAPSFKKARGFTRFADGSLAVHDPESAYFLGQVGVGKMNKVHLTDVFAGVAAVDLQPADFRPPRGGPPAADAGGSRVVVHLGSSDPRKCPDAETWVRLMRCCLEKMEGLEWELVGHGPDAEVARRIVHVIGSPRVRDRTGTASIFEVFGILAGARAVMGCDSVVTHMASLTGTPCFNLSFDAVNFWETGPLAPGSAVYRVPTPGHLIADEVGEAMRRFLAGDFSACTAVVEPTAFERYRLISPSGSDWSWRLIKALYFSQSWPRPESTTQLLALERLHEIAALALEELERDETRIRPKVAEPFWARLDELQTAVAQICPDIQPLLNWFNAERSQIGPGELEEIRARTRFVYSVLADIIVNIHSASPGEEQGHGNARMVETSDR